VPRANAKKSVKRCVLSLSLGRRPNEISRVKNIFVRNRDGEVSPSAFPIEAELP
jgi:hypothetical protein